MRGRPILHPSNTSKLIPAIPAIQGRASTGDVDRETDDGKVGELVEGAPVAGDGLWADTGSGAGEKEAGGSKVLPIEAFADQDEGCPPMTKTEKRRLWLKRRRSGEFYFRSEFKGLVHAVRLSESLRSSAMGLLTHCPIRIQRYAHGLRDTVVAIIGSSTLSQAATADYVMKPVYQVYLVLQ